MQDGHVVLGGDVGGLLDQHPADGVRGCPCPGSARPAGGLGRVPGQLDAAGLAAAAGLYLGLDDNGAADLGRGRLGLLGDQATLPAARPPRTWRTAPSPDARTGPCVSLSVGSGRGGWSASGGLVERVAEPLDDLLGGGARGEDLGHALLLEQDDVLAGMMPPPNTSTSSAPRSASSSTTRGNRVMWAPEWIEADGVGVLLDHGGHDLLRGLVQPGVDDLHAGVPQGLATTLAPRSCPSRPGLATTTRMRPCATVPAAPFGVAAGPRFAAGPHLGDTTRPCPTRPNAPCEDDRPCPPRPAPPRPGRDPGGQVAYLPRRRPDPQADPAQPARPRLDRRLGRVRARDPHRRGPVPGQEGRPRRPPGSRSRPSRPCRARSPRSPGRPAGSSWSTAGASCGPSPRDPARCGPPAGGSPAPASASAGTPRALPGERAARRPGGPAAAAPGPGRGGRRRPVRRPPLTP